MDALTLREFTPKNIVQTFDWVRNKELQRLFTMREEPTWEKHKKYFRKILSDPTQKVYAIYYKGKHIGNCGLKNIEKNQAEMWIYIGDKLNRGKGYGIRACKKLLSLVSKMGLSCIYLHVLSSNAHAISLYEKLGFHQVEMDAKDANEWKNRGLEVLKMEKCLYE